MAEIKKGPGFKKATTALTFDLIKHMKNAGINTSDFVGKEIGEKVI